MMDQHDLAQWIGLAVMIVGAGWRLRSLVTGDQLAAMGARLDKEDEKLHSRVSDSRDELRREIEKVETTQADQGVILGRIEGKLDTLLHRPGAPQ